MDMGLLISPGKKIRVQSGTGPYFLDCVPIRSCSRGSGRDLLDKLEPYFGMK